jgi:hypothetical protein
MIREAFLIFLDATALTLFATTIIIVSYAYSIGAIQ